MVEYSKKFKFSKPSKFKIEDLFLVLIMFFNKPILSLTKTHFSNFPMGKYSIINLVMESKNSSVLPLDNNLSEIITANHSCWRFF